MESPLASLRRLTTQVLLYRGGPGLGAGASAPGGRQVRFEQASGYEDYLGHWAADVGAIAALRLALQRAEPGFPVAYLAPQRLLAELAQRLVQGRLRAYELPAGAHPILSFDESTALMVLRQSMYQAGESPRVFEISDSEVLMMLARQLHQGRLVLTDAPDPARDGWPYKPPAAGAATAAPGTVAAVVNLNQLPDPPVTPPILPVLEEVQMEGAEVLPEIDQSLEQIDLTVASVDLAGVSLEPTPSKVPEISAAMSKASAEVDRTLGAL